MAFNNECIYHKLVVILCKLMAFNDQCIHHKLKVML